MSIQEKIKSYIENNGLIAKHIAENKLNMNYQTFHLLLNGKRKLTVEMYEKICKDGLGVSPKYFWDDD
ncbi:helix-turn-helix transcriptional regulator [Niallia sp. RD1]|uniref:helix-turn-helix domain-containing protein n=1 Tax=Niallia sp. RD1 TaxID=2962858 RepID=UPI0020C196A6|nr:helix-turn-helix transcriptional regulator [Niallia sp. RD1]UTI41135.1 helix-turn-helix domain-containing protein [Niallia sp. RD1]